MDFTRLNVSFLLVDFYFMSLEGNSHSCNSCSWSVSNQLGQHFVYYLKPLVVM